MTIEGSSSTISNDTGSLVVNQTANQVLQNISQTANQVLQNISQTANQVLQNAPVNNQSVTQALENIKGNLTAINENASKVATEAVTSEVQNVRENLTSTIKQTVSDLLPKSIQDMLLLVFLIIAIPLILNLIFVFIRRMSPPTDKKKQDSSTNKKIPTSIGPL